MITSEIDILHLPSLFSYAIFIFNSCQSCLGQVLAFVIYRLVNWKTEQSADKLLIFSHLCQSKFIACPSLKIIDIYIHLVTVIVSITLDGSDHQEAANVQQLGPKPAHRLSQHSRSPPRPRLDGTLLKVLLNWWIQIWIKSQLLGTLWIRDLQDWQPSPHNVVPAVFHSFSRFLHHSSPSPGRVNLCCAKLACI